MKEEELGSCPKCREEWDCCVEVRYQENNDTYWYSASCGCGYELEFEYDSEAECIKVWNNT